MLTAFTLATVAAHGGLPGPGLAIAAFFLIPLLFLITFLIIGAVMRRRWIRHGGGAGWAPGWGHSGPARSAEVTLAERFAQGDIDEKEYRARLEVLRSSDPTPPKR